MLYNVWINPHSGQDTNGNNGPWTDDKHWILVQVEGSDEFATPCQLAYDRLPKATQTLLNAKRCPNTDIDDFVEETCLWGYSFDFRVEEHGECDDWDEEADSDETIPRRPNPKLIIK